MELHKDTESLQHSGTRRRRCLDVFLVMSIILLFVAVSTVTAVGVMVIMELRSKLEEHSRPPFEYGTLGKLIGDTPSPAYKMQNFAYLEATESELRNSTMPLAPVYYGAGQSVGGHFSFNSDQHSLQPTQKGTYFMYLDLSVTCTSSRCSAGVLTVRVGDTLTCKVDLPAMAETAVTRKCWTVSWMDGNIRLVTQMTVPEEGLKDWKLEIRDSGLGMFLVD